MIIVYGEVCLQEMECWKLGKRYHEQATMWRRQTVCGWVDTTPVRAWLAITG